MNTLIEQMSSILTGVEVQR